ncbi:hypothetical protein D3C74_488140 [compost metagenome]
MAKNFKLHRALTVLQGQLLLSNINGDLFIYFTRGGLQRGFTLFQAAGNRLPEIGIVASL